MGVFCWFSRGFRHSRYIRSICNCVYSGVGGNFYGQMRLISTIIFCLLTSLASGQGDKSIYTELLNTYKTKGDLNKLLQKWSKASEVKGVRSDKLTGVEKVIYEIHNDFFNPFSFGFYGWEKWGETSWFTDSKYIVIQDKIPFKVVDRIDSLTDEMNCTDTIFNFRPQIKLSRAKTLYLLPDYQKAVRKFLDQGDQEDRYNKLDFLDCCLKTTIKNDWTTIITQPEILSLYITSDFKSAVVDYRLASTGMRTTLTFKDSKWTVLKSKEMWIE